MIDDPEGLNIHADFVSDASGEHRNRMKKAMYEMDQIVTDQLFCKTGDAQKMALSLYYNE